VVALVGLDSQECSTQPVDVPAGREVREQTCQHQQ
jgi:hypothetical protein